MTQRVQLLDTPSLLNPLQSQGWYLSRVQTPAGRNIDWLWRLERLARPVFLLNQGHQLSTAQGALPLCQQKQRPRYSNLNLSQKEGKQLPNIMPSFPELLTHDVFISFPATSPCERLNNTINPDSSDRGSCQRPSPRPRLHFLAAASHLCSNSVFTPQTAVTIPCPTHS